MVVHLNLFVQYKETSSDKFTAIAKGMDYKMNIRTVYVNMIIIVVVLIISSLAICENNITIDQESALQQSLFKNYNRYSKPVKVFSNRVNLKLFIFLY